MKPRTTYELDGRPFGKDPLYATEQNAEVQLRLVFLGDVSDEVHEKVSTIMADLQLIVNDANGLDKPRDIKEAPED